MRCDRTRTQQQKGYIEASDAESDLITYCVYSTPDVSGRLSPQEVQCWIFKRQGALACLGILLTSDRDVFIPVAMANSSSVGAGDVQMSESQVGFHLHCEFHGGIALLIRRLAG